MLMDKVRLRVSILHLPRILPLALPECWLMDDRSDPPTPQLNQSIQEQEELEERARRAQEAAAASDGWTLVTSRKVGIPRSEKSFSACGNASRARETAPSSDSNARLPHCSNRPHFVLGLHHLSPFDRPRGGTRTGMRLAPTCLRLRGPQRRARRRRLRCQRIFTTSSRGRPEGTVSRWPCARTGCIMRMDR